MDFVVLDFEEDENFPLILGMPFLYTAKAIIDVYNGTLTLRVGEVKRVELYTLVSKDLAQSKQGVEHSGIWYYLVLTGQIIRWIGKVKSKWVLRIEITNYTNN